MSNNQATSQTTQNPATEPELTVIVTIVSGPSSLRKNLSALCRQLDLAKNEIIVPFDKWSDDVRVLIPEFPDVNFHFVEDLGAAESSEITSHQHRLFDRRRAVGIQIARGRIIAMTEDHAVPADDWCMRILVAHELPNAVIGGAIENGIDHPLNWAFFYCDFGRYGRPFPEGKLQFVSDVNVAYKRDALFAINEVWRDAYHETTVHWSLTKGGEELVLDDRIVVYQHRPRLSLIEALKERAAWGRVFAETRVNAVSFLTRFVLALGTVFLPFLLLVRAIGHMIRHKRSFRQMITAVPLIFLLLIGWSFGEFLGYVVGDDGFQSQERSLVGEGS